MSTEGQVGGHGLIKGVMPAVRGETGRPFDAFPGHVRSTQKPPPIC